MSAGGEIDIGSLPRWGADVEAGREGEALAKVVRFPYHPEYNARLVLAPETGFERLACDVIVVATNEACGPDFQKAMRARAPLKVTETHIVPVPNHAIAARFVFGYGCFCAVPHCCCCFITFLNLF